MEDAGGGVEAQEQALNQVGRNTNTNIYHKMVQPLIEKNPGVYEDAARELLKRHPEAEAISPAEAAAVRVKVRGGRVGVGLDEKLAVHDILQQRAEQAIADNAGAGTIDIKAIEQLVNKNPEHYESYAKLLNTRYKNSFSSEETALVRVKVKQGMTEGQAATDVLKQRSENATEATTAGKLVETESSSQASIAKETTEGAAGTPEANAAEEAAKADTTTLKKLKQKLNKEIDTARKIEKKAQGNLDAIQRESDEALNIYSEIEATQANKHALKVGEAKLNGIQARLKIAQGNLEKAQIATRKAVRNRNAKIAAATVIATGVIAVTAVEASK